MPEVGRGGHPGMGEERSQPMPGLVQKTGEREIVFTAPKQEGASNLGISDASGVARLDRGRGRRSWFGLVTHTLRCGLRSGESG